MKSLDKKQIRRVRFLIMNWESKLTWKKLVIAIENEMGIKISRQTLNEYVAIKRAYLDKKGELRLGIRDIRMILDSSESDKAKEILKLRKKLEMCEKDLYAQLNAIETIMENARELNIQFPQLLSKKR